MKELPTSAAIIGSGATGAQLASVMQAFGCQITLLDVMPTILPGEDPEVSTLMQAQFEQRGMEVITGIGGVERIEKRGDIGYTLVYNKDGQEHRADVDQVMLAVGWPGNTETLGLDAAGIETERHYIKVNDSLRTTADHIFAAGDITGKMMLVQSASSQARTAVENALLGHGKDETYGLIPHGGFTDPEYGSVGLTEAKAREQHGNIAVATVPYANVDRAVIDGRTVGFCKLIVNAETHQIVGAHVVGEQALEVVQVVAAGMAGGLSIDKLAELQLAYPTFAAVVGLAARQLVRELDIVALQPEWRALARVRAAEWERLDPQAP
jgi:pyruvate/2-oxoglutarate dehydrogenase complex dihydrolipoamide dehydrogenase (E3) component